MSSPALGHVVVAGGSVAGLLAAHVLAPHADRVTIVDRDDVDGDGEPGPRPGVPQSRHTHVLLTSGIRALEELLPGFTGELTGEGGLQLSVPADLGVWQAGQWIARTNPSAPVLSATRPLLEHLLRRRVLAGPSVELLPSSEVVGLLGGPGRITGVVLRGRAGQGRQELAADLVVDATGRSTRAADWLTGLGIAPAAEETLETGRAYATGIFTAGETLPAGHPRGFYIVPDARQPFGTIILPVEQDRWMVTLSGPRGQAPPTDPGGFVDFAAALPHEAPHKWLTTAVPVARAMGYRHTANRRRRYDRGARTRAGLLAVGDAACTLNPVYGQGMSAAALNAVALSRALAAARGVPATADLQRAVLRSSRRAWDVATAADSTMPGATGDALRDGPADRIVNRYLDRVQRHVPGDPVVCEAFRDVLFLLAPPSSLLTSGRVLRRTLLHAPATTPPGLPAA